MIRQAVILCGGLGTRLGALTAQMPKPLLRVGEIPFLDVLLFELGRHGLRRILLLAGFAADRVLEYVNRDTNEDAVRARDRDNDRTATRGYRWRRLARS
jgi:NDP-sugar pyrophosphorylase family protein